MPRSRWILSLLFVGMLDVLWGQDVATLREHLANLSPQEKEELYRKQQRFYALPPERQEQLRQLHEALRSAPDSQELDQVLRRYHEWLKTLQPGERAELLSLPPDRRIERIKQLLEAQELRRFRQLTAARFNDNDVNQIFEWLREYTRKHAAELLEQMPPERRKAYEANSDNPFHRGWLLTRTLLEQDIAQLRISDQEVADLLARLSPSARELLPRETDVQQRNRMIRSWIDVALFSQFRRERPPPVDQDELARFLENEITDRERAFLESLPAEMFRVEAESLYHFYKSRYAPGRGRGRSQFSRRGSSPENDPPPRP